MIFVLYDFTLHSVDRWQMPGQLPGQSGDGIGTAIPGDPTVRMDNHRKVRDMSMTADDFMNTSSPMFFLSKEHLVFNYASVKWVMQETQKYQKANAVMILLNPKRKMLVAKPCDGDAKYATQIVNSVLLPRVIQVSPLFWEMSKRDMAEYGYAYLMTGTIGSFVDNDGSSHMAIIVEVESAVKIPDQDVGTGEADMFLQDVERIIAKARRRIKKVQRGA